MTPAERDEVRAIAADNAKRRGHADACDCDRCRHDRAVLRYVPAGDATDSGVASEWVAAFPHKARRLAHALHAAADAAEET